jgi:hypothetical protein
MMKKIVYFLGISFVLLTLVLFHKTSIQNKDVSQASESNCIVFSVSSCHSYDITDINKLYKNVDLVLIGTVSEKFQAQKKETQISAYTPGKLEVDTLIKGDLSRKTVNFLVEGGTITLSEYERSIINVFPEVVKKEQLDSLDKKTKDSTYIKYVSEFSTDFNKNQRYVMFLNQIGDTDEYVVLSYAGMIPVDNSKKISNLSDIAALPKIEK